MNDIPSDYDTVLRSYAETVKTLHLECDRHAVTNSTITAELISLKEAYKKLLDEHVQLHHICQQTLKDRHDALTKLKLIETQVTELYTSLNL